MEQKPDAFISTRESLLGRLKDWQDHDSWHEFFKIYRRLIFSTALKSGLTESEAEEVLQETVISVAKTIKEFKYDRKRCTFKSWLGHLTRKRIADQFRKRGRERAAPHPRASATDTPQTPAIERVPDPKSFDAETVWNQEWQQKLLEAAIEKVKGEAGAAQFQMFDLYVIRKLPAREAASALGTSVGRVYLAKHRVSRLIKKEVKRLETQMSRG